jgi:hypothetical protein
MPPLIDLWDRAVNRLELWGAGRESDVTSADAISLSDALVHARERTPVRIDWMPGGTNRGMPVGDPVPAELRGRWTIEVGPSRRLLAPLLRRIELPSRVRARQLPHIPEHAP